MSEPTWLSNQLLVAMPGLGDSNFAQSVTLICEHSERGALGIVLNKPMNMKLGEVLSQLHLDSGAGQLGEQPVLRGGPVGSEKGFVLHRPGGHWDSTHRVSESVQVTTSRDVLSAMARGTGPQDAFIALGYASWEAGQLERELLENSWMTVPMSERIVFELPYAERWAAAWQVLGVESSRVSPSAGHA